VDRFHAKFCGRLIGCISLFLEDLDIVEKPIDSCHSRENGNPVGILLLDSGSAPGMTLNRPLFGLEITP